MMREATFLSELGQMALELAARGWAVFPLGARSKIPLPGSKGFLDASTDPAKIQAWWRQMPNANVGIATGAVSGGLCVVDVDPRNGGDEALDALEHTHGRLPLTVRQQTGGGGWHLLFKPPAGTALRCGVLCPGVEFKADGGYIVGPLSTHPKTGQQYGWEATSGPDDVDLAELPAWVVATLGGKDRAAGKEGDVDAAKSFLGAAFEAAGWLGKRLGDGRRAVLCPWQHEHSDGKDYDTSTILFPPRTGETFGWFKCSHSHCCGRGGKEVLLALPRPAREAAEKAYPKVGAEEPSSAAPAPATWPELADLVDAIGAEGARLSSGFKTLDEITRGGFPMGKRIALLGAPGAGKTTLAVQLAHQWAKAGVPVVYLANDEPRQDILIRLGQQEGYRRELLDQGAASAKAGLADHLRALPFWILDPDVDVAVDIEAIAVELRRRHPEGPAVLVLDSLQTLAAAIPDTRAGDGARSKVDLILRQVKTAARAHRLLILLLSEMNRSAYRFKGESPNEDIAAGKESGGIEYGCDMLLLLRNLPKGQDGKSGVAVACPKNRLGKKEPFGLLQNHDSATFREVALPESADSASSAGRQVQTFDQMAEEILSVVRAHPGIGGAQPLARRMGKGDHAVRPVFQELARAGRIVNRPRARTNANGKAPAWYLADAAPSAEPAEPADLADEEDGS